MRQARPLPLLLAIVLLAAATGAHASGVSLRWDHCHGDAGVQNKNFACNTNAGGETLVGGFTLGADLAHVSGNEVVVNFAMASFLLPAWWDFFNVGTCRTTSLGMNLYNPTAVNCLDWGAGLEVGGIGAYNIFPRGYNTSRLKAAIAVPANTLQDLVAGQEYFSFNLTIDHKWTVSNISCQGCETPVCIVLASINVTTPFQANDRKLSGPAYGGDSDFVTWQGGGGVTVGPVTGCPAATPTTKRTWGAVKALYH